MKKIDEDRDILTRDIEGMRDSQFEQMFLITFYGLSSYFKSLFTFGSKSSIARDSIRVIKEMFDIVKTERRMLDFILKNMDSFDIESTSLVVAEMDQLNDKTVEYYYKVLDDIDEACECEVERFGIRPRKTFDTLTQTDSYTNQVIALAENKDSIKRFLGFEEKFWEFIKDKETGNSEYHSDKDAKKAFVVPVVDDSNNVVDIKMCIPKVVDLESALLTIRLYRRAYDLYMMLNKPLRDENICDYIETQDRYRNHLFSKSQKLLKLKM